MIGPVLPPFLLLTTITIALLLLLTNSLADDENKQLFGDYVAARGTLVCYNRPFQGIVKLMNCATLQQFSEFITMDWVHTDPEGAFELAGVNPKTDTHQYNPCIYISYKCKEPSEDAENDETKWEYVIGPEKQLNEQNADEEIDELIERVENLVVKKDPIEPSGPDPPPNSFNDNDEDVTSENFLMIYVPKEEYTSKKQIPGRFFELGRINLAGRIRRT